MGDPLTREQLAVARADLNIAVAWWSRERADTDPYDNSLGRCIHRHLPDLLATLQAAEEEIQRLRAASPFIDDHQICDQAVRVRDEEITELRHALVEKDGEIDDKSDVGHRVADGWQATVRARDEEITRLTDLLDDAVVKGVHWETMYEDLAARVRP